MRRPAAAGWMPALSSVPARCSIQAPHLRNRLSKAKAPAAAKAAAKQAKVELVTLRQLAAAIGEAHGLSQKQADDVLAGAVTLVGEHLKKGARIRIAGLGTLEVRKRSARTGRNPATGEPMEIKARKKVAFRAAKDLSEAI